MNNESVDLNNKKIRESCIRRGAFWREMQDFCKSLFVLSCLYIGKICGFKSPFVSPFFKVGMMQFSLC